MNIKKSANCIGPQVRRIRTSSGLSQEELAAKCQRNGWDISRITIAKIEARIRRVSDIEVRHLARNLNVSIHSLYGV